MSDQPQVTKDPDFEKNFKWKSDEVEDLIMKRIYEVYDIEEEPEESDENEELEGEDHSLLSTRDYDATYPLPSDEPPATWDDPTIGFWKSLSTTSKVLGYFAILWPVFVSIVQSLFPDLFISFINDVPIQLVSLLPSCISLGVNGILILYNQDVKEAEPDSKRLPKTARGYLAMLLGWGGSAFLIWRYLL